MCMCVRACVCVCVCSCVRECLVGRVWFCIRVYLPNLQMEVPADVVVQVEDEHWPGCSEDDPRARHHDDIGRVVPDESYHSRCHLWEGNVEHGEHEQPAR